MHEFEDIIGNKLIKQQLQRMVAKGTVAHSLLFAGPDGIGKGLFADNFARLLLCQNDPEGKHRHKLDAGVHPDLRVYYPEGKIGAHSIDSMRQFIEEVHLSPFEAEKKVFIIHDAERMLPSGANALLKTLEEPSPWCVIILLSSNPEGLLPTILSRCQILQFRSIPEEQIAQFIAKKYDKPLEAAHAIATLSEGSIGNADKLAGQNGDRIRKYLLELLSQGKLSTYTQLMKSAAEVTGFIEETQKASEEATRAEILKAYSVEPNAVQQQAIDKEIDGRNAMHLQNNAKAIFTIVLSWYRDMHLLAVKGNRSFLINLDFEDQITQALQRGEIIPIEKVQAAVSQAMLSLARSTPLRSILENFFLQLNLII